MKKPTQQQIDLAARAIRATFADRIGSGKKWHALPEHIKAQYRAEAEAALIAASCADA